MSKLFISYASKDRILVESILLHLKSLKHEVWIDVVNIAAGEKWEEEIISALNQAEICIVMITPAAIESEWVVKEVKYARELNKKLIPVLLYDIPSIRYLEILGIRDLQIIDFYRYGFATGIENLSQSLDSKSSYKGTVRALIIEDITEQQMMIKQVLHSLNIEAIVAPDYNTAFDLIRNELFDLVTLDMQLSPIDTNGEQGLLLLDQLKSFQPRTKIIIVSSLDWTGQQVRDFLLRYQANDYIKKPYTMVDLRNLVAGLITNAK